MKYVWLVLMMASSMSFADTRTYTRTCTCDEQSEQTNYPSPFDVIGQSWKNAFDAVATFVGAELGGLCAAFPLWLVWKGLVPGAEHLNIHRDGVRLHQVCSLIIGALAAGNPNTKTSIGTRFGGVMAALSSLVGLLCVQHHKNFGIYI